MGQGNGLVIVERDSRVKRYECLKIYVYVIMKSLSYIINMLMTDPWTRASMEAQAS